MTGPTKFLALSLLATAVVGCGAGSPEPAVPPSGGEAPASYSATPTDRSGKPVQPSAPKSGGGDVYTGPSGGSDRR